MTRKATITTTAPAPAVSDETIARVLSLFERLMDHKTTVDAHLGFDVPVRQLFVLLIAMELPVGPPESYRDVMPSLILRPSDPCRLRYRRRR